MLRRRSLFSAAFACALIGVLSPISVLAQSALQAGQSAVVANTEGRGLRLRGGPAMTYRVVSTVPEGTSVQIIAGPVSDGGDDWYQVSAGGTTGWGVGQYLSSGPVMRAMSVNENGMRVFLAKTTAYSDGIGGISMGARTSSGTNTRWGVVAVDPKVIPIGSVLLIEGYDDAIFVAEDVGPGIRGEALDIWLPDAAEARRYGTQYRKVTVLSEGVSR